ncbi:MAG: MBL fold metallo-hydrolase [Candidatus Cloacimonetes bacterium]|nr:MBL fold metallo-hydrolase [Candidatus Cloacimonadota bacterium]
MDFKRFNTLPSFGTNTYLVWDKDRREAILIDPGAASRQMVNFVETNNITVKAIVNTHGHADHIGGNAYFQKKWGVPIWIHEADEEKLNNPQLNLSSFMGKEIISPGAERLLHDGDKIILGRKEIDVIHTPGHTKGGICLYYSILLFAGDTLFKGSIGRTDFPDGDLAELTRSIKEKLYSLPDETLVLPGHTEETRIGIEKRMNPFVRM